MRSLAAVLTVAGLVVVTAADSATADEVRIEHKPVACASKATL